MSFRANAWSRYVPSDNTHTRVGKDLHVVSTTYANDNRLIPPY